MPRMKTFAAFCSLILLGNLCAHDLGIYIDFKGERKSFENEPIRSLAYLKQNVPNECVSQKIVWDHWDTGKPWVSTETCNLPDDLVLKSFLYLKNTIRIITVSFNSNPDSHRIILFQQSNQGLPHIVKTPSGAQTAISHHTNNLLTFGVSDDGRLTISP